MGTVFTSQFLTLVTLSYMAGPMLYYTPYSLEILDFDPNLISNFETGQRLNYFCVPPADSGISIK